MLYRNLYIENAAETSDIRVTDGVFEEIAAHLEPRVGEEVIDLGGKLALPPFIESHVHLDTCLTAGEPKWNMSGTLFEGIETWALRKETLTKQDVRDRVNRAVRLYAANGIQHIRTHVDVIGQRLLKGTHIFDGNAVHAADGVQIAHIGAVAVAAALHAEHVVAHGKIRHRQREIAQVFLRRLQAVGHVAVVAVHAVDGTGTEQVAQFVQRMLAKKGQIFFFSGISTHSFFKKGRLTPALWYSAYSAALSSSSSTLAEVARPASPWISLGMMILVALPSATFWKASRALSLMT